MKGDKTGMNFDKLVKVAVICLVVGFGTIIGLQIGGTLFGPQTTGVCIFKGQPFYGYGLFGGTSSSGIPLRGINVTAWNHYEEPFVSGFTNRLGCFEFKADPNSNWRLSYTYNGTNYSDPVNSGVILQDNVP